jgi:hypothetical protein
MEPSARRRARLASLGFVAARTATRTSRCLCRERNGSRSGASRAPVTRETSGLPETSTDFHGLSVAVSKTARTRTDAAPSSGTAWLSGGGGIRTLERPVTSNGFRDRHECIDLQGFLCSCASLCASHVSQISFVFWFVNPVRLKRFARFWVFRAPTVLVEGARSGRAAFRRRRLRKHRETGPWF